MESESGKNFLKDDDIEAGYKAMAADVEYNKEANEWIEGVSVEVVGENDWGFEKVV